MSLFKNASTVLLTSAVGMALGLVTSVISARWLSLGDRGILAVASTITVTIVMIAQLGWPAAAIYRLRRIRSDPSRVVSATLTGVLGLGAIALGTALLLEQHIAGAFLAGAPRIVFYLAIAAVPFGLVANAFCGISRGIDRFSIQNWYRFALGFAQMLGTAFVLIVAGRGLRELLGLNLVISAVLALGLVVAVVRGTGLSRRPELAEVREISKIGVQAWVQNVAGILHERVDVFMLAFLLSDPGEVAIYTIAVSVSSLILLAPEAAAGAVLPQLAGSERDEAARLAATLVRHATLWMVVVALLAAPTAPFLLPAIYGENYAGSVPVFLLLLGGVLFLTVYRLLNRYFMAIDRQAVNITVQVSATTINVALNLYLIPRYGAIGAALASMLSYSAEGLVIATIFHRSTGLPFRQLFVFRKGDFEPYLRRLRSSTH